MYWLLMIFDLTMNGAEPFYIREYPSAPTCAEAAARSNAEPVRQGWARYVAICRMKLGDPASPKQWPM